MPGENADSDQLFLTRLLDIYANKTRNYLTMCHRRVVHNLRAAATYPAEHVEAMTTQHIIESTFSQILEIDKTAILPTLLILLQQRAPGLAISLGMATMTKEGDAAATFYNLNQQMTSVFVNYLARYQLARDLAVVDLQELCTAVEVQAPELFPVSLLQSLVQQKVLSSLLQSAIGALSSTEPNTSALWAGELANSIRNYPQIFRRCLSGILYYFCNCIKSTQLAQEYQDLFFNHLQNQPQLLQFIDAVCVAYIDTLSSIEALERIFTQNQIRAATALSKLCLPAFPLLGIKIVAIDESQITTRKNRN